MNHVSPLAAKAVASSVNSYSELHISNGRLYWLERLADQGGRTTIMRSSKHGIEDILPRHHNCRSRVHEYGGGVLCVGDDQLFFVEDSDQQIYLLTEQGTQQLTHHPHLRFADLDYDTDHHRLFAVCENHGSVGLPASSIVCIDTGNGELTTIVQGADFYTSPRYHNGKLAWMSWDFPNMPWDQTSLYITDINDDNSAGNSSCVFNQADTSLFQPRWHQQALYFVSDASGWWNIHRYQDGDITNILPDDAEYGLPHWVFGQSMYGFIDNEMIAVRNHEGRHELVAVDLRNGEKHQLQAPAEHIEYLATADGICAFIAHPTDANPAIVRLNTDKSCAIIAQTELALDIKQLSTAQAVSLANRYSNTIHAFYYPPVQHHVENSPPPLIVLGHGGPTGQSTAALDLRKQFWTGRGFAILDVNYSGSTGFGRDYRNSLYGHWGQLDVTDLCDAALAACEQGLADRDKLIIKGSSAGGYTVLAALCFENVFSAGASYYGISDLETLATDTHKFEARYLDKLVGPYPEYKQTYIDRSPVHHADGLNCPVIFLQGAEDKVVPPEQADMMVSILDSKSIPVAYRLYPGEQHGFRNANTIIDALESEYCFYCRVFEYESDCELAIKNL